MCVCSWESEDLIRGNRDAFWGIVKMIHAAYPQICSDGHQFLSCHNLPYSRRDMKRLANTLLHWIYSLGVLGPGLIPSDIEEIRGHLLTPIACSPLCSTADISSGVLLCDIVAEVLGRAVSLALA